MKILSSHFGELDVPEEKIIRFTTSIPGFEGKHKYFILTENEGNEADGDSLFCWLHCAEDVDVAFALLDVFKVKPDYQPEIEEEFLNEIKFSDGDDISVYNIVNIPEKVDDMTVNLLAPVVINLTKKVGMQVVLNNEVYGLRHKIFDEIKKAAKNGEGKEV